jgi:hypothetical protein
MYGKIHKILKASRSVAPKTATKPDYFDNMAFHISENILRSPLRPIDPAIEVLVIKPSRGVRDQKLIQWPHYLHSLLGEEWSPTSHVGTHRYLRNCITEPSVCTGTSRLPPSIRFLRFPGLFYQNSAAVEFKGLIAYLIILVATQPRRLHDLQMFWPGSATCVAPIKKANLQMLKQGTRNPFTAPSFRFVFGHEMNARQFRMLSIVTLRGLCMYVAQCQVHRPTLCAQVANFFKNSRSSSHTHDPAAFSRWKTQLRSKPRLVASSLGINGPKSITEVGE